MGKKSETRSNRASVLFVNFVIDVTKVKYNFIHILFYIYIIIIIIMLFYIR